MNLNTRSWRFALLFALLTACATAGSDDGADARIFIIDAPPGSADAPPGTPDARETPDARVMPVELTITHSTDTTTITPANSISCNGGTPTFLHSDNAYFRVFDLVSFGILSDYTVSEISIGIETATGAGGTQPVTVRIYTLVGALALGNLTQVGIVNTTVADTAAGIVLDIPITAVVAASSTMVVEFFTPDGQGAGHSLFVGSNAGGQSGPSYLVAVACGATEPTDIADLGFPEMNMVLSVTGTHIP